MILSRGTVKMSFVAAVVGTALVSAFPGSPAWGDAVYHSQHIALHPVGTAPLSSGFVENIHANGPTVYAMERSVLAHARPGSYAMTLHPFGDTSCTTGIGAIPSVTFATNAVGNGVGQLRLPSAAIPAGFHGATIGVVWELAGTTGATYATTCSTVVLD